MSFVKILGVEFVAAEGSNFLSPLSLRTAPGLFPAVNGL